MIKIDFPLQGDPGDVKFYRGYAISYGESICSGEAYGILEILGNAKIVGDGEELRLAFSRSTRDHAVLHKMSCIMARKQNYKQSVIRITEQGIRCNRLFSDSIRNLRVLEETRESQILMKLGFTGF